MNVLRHLAAAALFPLLLTAGCGGGGGDEASTAPNNDGSTQEVATYGDTNLPGRLILTDSVNPATIYNLRTGQGTTLPTSATGGGNWLTSTNPATILRVGPGTGGKRTVERLRTSDWTAIGPSTLLGGWINRLKVSPDGRYFLVFWAESMSEDLILTIFDAETGAVVKSGSPLDNRIVISSPAAWLPDGRYVFLAGRRLYVSSPTSNTDTLVATLPLPDNSVFQNGDFQSGFTNLTVSPDGQKIAFNWGVPRRNSNDTHIFVANVDGTGLHQLTAPPDPSSPLDYGYGSVSWSPDSRWVAAALYMNGSTVAPVFPPDQSFPGVPGGVIGSTGCSLNPVFVLPVEANQVAIPWPGFDVKYGIKVRDSSGTAGRWLSACGGVQWVE